MRYLAASAAALMLAACHPGVGAGGVFPFPPASPPPGPLPTTSPPPGPLLFIADSGNNSIFIFQRNATGVVLPLHTINGPATLLAAPFPIATDPAGNIWIANHLTPPELLEFRPGALGNDPPTTIMFVSSRVIPAALDVRGLAFGPSGKLYVATGTTNHLIVFSSGAAGTPTPIQDINGINTQLNDAEGIALDTSGNIYTASKASNAILEFAADANGNTAPIRVIKGFFSTKLSLPSYVAVDTSGDVFVLNASNGIINVYGPGAGGDVAPIASFTRPSMGGQISFDAAGNLYVGALSINPGVVLVYAPPITSTSKPVQMLSTPVLTTPTGVFAP